MRQREPIFHPTRLFGPTYFLFSPYLTSSFKSLIVRWIANWAKYFLEKYSQLTIISFEDHNTGFAIYISLSTSKYLKVS